MTTNPTPEQRILATHLLDNLDAVIETLPPECRPSGIDPSECGHPRAENWHGPNGRVYCGGCGLLLIGGDVL